MAQFKANMDLLGLDIPPDYFSKLYKYHWIVYAKTAFAGPKSVIEYLGRYSHPVTNHKIQLGYFNYYQ
jgi:hypothetical protein